MTFSLLSIGIEKYNDHKHIVCASSDSQNIYAVLAEVLGANFSHAFSSCFKNIDSKQFLELLEMYSSFLSDCDCFILYFSGHGALNGSSFSLVFSNDHQDYEIRGKISVETLYEKLSGIKSKVILILDCCHSGASSKLTISPDMYDKSKISILASSSAINTSTFDENGSLFTNHFLKSVKDLYDMGVGITLNSISDAIKNQGYQHVQVSTQEGVGDIVLSQSKKVQDADNFVRDCIQKYQKSSLYVREVLWYEVADLPVFIKYKLFTEYRHCCLYKELSWLVRRAIGTFLYKLPEDTTKHKFLITLLMSEHWADKCIGLIGARYSIQSSDKIRTCYEESLKDQEVIDCVWLAHLYLVDTKVNTVDLFLETFLTKSSWGIIEIWKRLEDALKTPDTIARIKEKCSQKDFSLFCTYLKLENNCNNIDDIKNNYDQALIDSKFIQKIYSSKKARGKITDITSKWLYSKLHGNWRDQVYIDYNEYFKNMKNCDITDALQHNMKMLPVVEIRMSLFNFFKTQKDINKYKDLLLWGLKDEYPWVVKEVISLFDKETISNNIEDISSWLNTFYQNRNTHPGFFDLVVELEKKGINTRDYLTDLTKNDLESLETILSLENIQ